MKWWKIWSDFGAEQNEERSEKSGFLFIPLFLREWEIDVWKKFSEQAKFFCSRGLLKAVFLQFFLFMRFDYDIVLDLGSFW